MSCHILCAHSDPGVVRRLEKALGELAGGVFRFGAHESGDALLTAALGARRAGEEVAIVFCGLSLAGMDGGDLFRTLKEEPLMRGTRKILLDGPDDAEAVDALLQRGAIQARLDPDFEDERLEKLLKGQLTDYVVNTAPHLIDDLHPLLDLRVLAGAFGSAKENLERLTSRLSEVQRSVIGEDRLSDDKAEAGMIDEFDRILHHPDRRSYAPEEIMVRAGDEAGTIWIILSGRVQLFRTIEGEEVIFHSESAGRIVGLMSLSLQNPVFFSCRAATEVKALVLSRDQVREAIEQSPVLSHYLITVIMRSMARRNGRAAELLMEVRSLNVALAHQRDELATTLKELRATQNRLVDSTKMATLGNLAAGMAHELNNPVGAMLSSTEHLGRDIEELLGSVPELKAATEAIPLARSSPPLSTRDERRLRNELAKDLDIGSKDAARLVTAGVHSKGHFKKLAKKNKKIGQKQLIKEVIHAGQIGTALRNITNCAGRVAALVRSLKLYARNDENSSENVDLNESLDDVLLLLTNKLKEVELSKDYGSVPPLQANASQLQQVWTNLISNALQVAGDDGRITIRTASPRPDWLRVEVEDNGPGIPTEIRDRLFEARFTTRAGRVEFGLGFGLPIARNIVRQHGGDIRFDSQPGRTIFTVDLPRVPPAPESNSPNHNPLP